MNAEGPCGESERDVERMNWLRGQDGSADHEAEGNGLLSPRQTSLCLSPWMADGDAPDCDPLSLAPRRGRRGPAVARTESSTAS